MCWIVPIGPRAVYLAACVALTGCGPALVFNDEQDMTVDQMLQRADHAFIGVIEKQSFEPWPLFQVPGYKRGDWEVLRRRVRVENVLRGSQPRKEIDIYEIFWTDGASGDWNATQNGQRCLFLVRTENGRYHVVRDWWRSVIPINSGRHARLPLDDSHPFWERFALLQYWIQPGWNLAIGSNVHKDPGAALGAWRAVKIERGLLRYPDHRMQRMACENLLLLGPFQDECIDLLTPQDLVEHGLAMPIIVPGQYRSSAVAWKKEQRFVIEQWNDLMSRERLTSAELDELRVFTAISDQALRTRLCREFDRRFPTDHDNACPPDRPLPATIVTEAGDVPLTGPWPVQK